MSNIYDTAKAYTKKDLTSLPSIDLKSLEVKEASFGEGEAKKNYKYVEIDGWKYTLKANVLSAIKDILEVRPTTTKVKVYLDKEGETRVMPLD
jgi:hypothetical protein